MYAPLADRPDAPPCQFHPERAGVVLFDTPPHSPVGHLVSAPLCPECAADRFGRLLRALQDGFEGKLHVEVEAPADPSKAWQSPGSW